MDENFKFINFIDRGCPHTEVLHLLWDRWSDILNQKTLGVSETRAVEDLSLYITHLSQA